MRDWRPLVHPVLRSEISCWDTPSLASALISAHLNALTTSLGLLSSVNPTRLKAGSVATEVAHFRFLEVAHYWPPGVNPGIRRPRRDRRRAATTSGRDCRRVPLLSHKRNSDRHSSETTALIDNQRSHLDRHGAGSARHCDSRSESGPNFARPVDRERRCVRQQLPAISVPARSTGQSALWLPRLLVSSVAAVPGSLPGGGRRRFTRGSDPVTERRGSTPRQRQASAYSCQSSGMPLRVWVPRSVNCRPEPAVRSRTVRETRTSPPSA